MADKDPTPEDVAKEVEAQAQEAEPVEAIPVETESKSKIPKPKMPKVKAPNMGGMVGGMTKSMKDMTQTFTDSEKRSHFLSHEDMEPHRILAMLLGLTVIITIIVSLVF